ncbi:MAG: M42 family peptidase, partial [Oscillospiraceae bacterium]|nr:M42 family peptidase [Oscillospiraceae bacterium]
MILAAHMDEVGIVVTEHAGEGFYRFAFSGGVDARVVLGKPVQIGARRGVISPGKAWHLASKAERETAPKPESLYIDMFGDCGVCPGEFGTFVSEFREFGNGFVKAKAIDDRFGCAVLLTLMRERYARNVYYAFTVQEEVGCRGAEIAANRLNGDTVIVVESTTAADYPSRSGGEQVCRLGAGAVVPFMDGGTIYHRGLWGEITAIAEREHIPWQTKTRVAGGTDARSF